MFQAIFAFTSGFLYVGNLLRGLARGVLALRNLHDITSRLIPTLASPPPTHLLDAPIAPLDLLEEFRTISSSGGLIVIEVPPLVLPSPIPTHSYQSSLATVTPNRLLDLAHLLLLLSFIFGLVLLLPGLVYVCATIAGRISALSRLSRKSFKAFGFSLVPIFSLVLLFSLVPNFFPTQIFSLRLHVSPASLLLLWIGPPALASFFALIYIISKLPVYQKFSNKIVNILQRCGLLTPPVTQTSPILASVYEQIVNKTVTYNNFIWHRSQPSGLKQDQTPIFTDVGTTSSPVELQYREQELLYSLTQHKLELEQQRQHILKTQRIYAAFADSQNSLRRELEVSRTRERKLQADLLAAERARKKLKGLIVTLEASGVVLRSNLTTREAAITFDQQSKLASEKDHVIRSTNNKELFPVRARLQDAEDKIARLDAELASERKLRIHKTKELDEQTKARRLHKAEMRRVARKTSDVQEQLDLLDDVLSQSRAHTQSLLDDPHTPYLTNYAIAITPDDTGQPLPPPLEPSIPDVRTPLLDSITRPRPLLPKSLRRTPERNPHDPTTRRSPHHPRQISACLGRLSDSATSQRSGVEGLLDLISQLEAVRAREAESRKRPERCRQEDLAPTKERLLHVAHEVTKANCKLNREQKTLRGTKGHAQEVTRDLNTWKTKLKDVQDAPRSSIVRFCNVVELFRQRSVDLESLRAEAEASKSKHSEAVYLSAMLQKRVEILEAIVKSLSLNQRREEMHSAHVNSPLFCPPDKDPPHTAHSVEHPLSSPSPPSNILPISSPLQTILSLDNVPSNHDPPQRLEVSPTHHPPPPFQSGILSPSQACSVAFLPVGSSVGSVDWPPIGSTLQPSGKNAEQDSGVGVLKTLRLPPLQEADHMSSTSPTFLKPPNLTLRRFMISRPLIFGVPVHRLGVRGSPSFRSTNVAVTEPPNNFTPASNPLPELVSESHHSVLSSHTPPGSPPMPGGGFAKNALKPSSRSTPEPPLPRLLPGLLDSTLIREHAVLDEDSPCAFGKSKITRRPNHYRAYRRPQDIQTLDYGLPEDFIPGTGCVAIEPPDRGLDEVWNNDFAFLIPLDCPTSTPIATSRWLASKQPSPEPDTKFPSFGHSPPGLTSPPSQSKRKPLSDVDYNHDF